ncbi:uncharacterized protein BDW43DRAFT_217326 [Aspergillus alliaceus]|uniref:uncharacterized protein n=1 Tax=Petromyces alliaceus TaxID=209559 RepID=UPI0012A3C7B2|nr:uncharacterized protein BDW43DRAFT_217326 [Aspergillus alliaceus]KAB8228420.1 hypothetical protein BDW43DRAFT_217326 [Aspergillus alliaceus]
MPSAQDETHPLFPVSSIHNLYFDQSETSLSSSDPSLPSDRSYIRYERAPTSQMGQELTSHDEAPPAVGFYNTRSISKMPSVDLNEVLDETTTSDTLHPPGQSEQTPRSHVETSRLDHEPGQFRCPSKYPIAQRWNRWVPITILILAVYATVGSGAYLAVACWKPWYGNFIGDSGVLSASTAKFMAALLAKTIELAYVTVFVTFIGQFLSRRSLKKGSRGISLSDIIMDTREIISRPLIPVINHPRIS